MCRGPVAVPSRGGKGVLESPAWNLPNSITVFRIFLVPLLVVVLLTKEPFGRDQDVLGLAIFLIAALSDWLDGWLARRDQKVTHIGKLLDPLADKLLASTALIVLLAMGRIPAWATWMVVVIIGRELAVTGLRSIASAGGQVMGASSPGKMKALCQNVAIGALLFPPETLGIARPLGMTLLFVATALTLWSGYQYFAEYFRSRAAEPGDGEPS